MPDYGIQNKSFWATFVPAAMTVGVIFVMVLCAEGLDEKEIIFPEIAAISVGYLVSPRRAWVTDSLHIFVLITLCAWLGLGIVLFLPVPLYWQIVIAFVLSQLIYTFSGTTFAPLVSAAVLPVILQTRSVVYPISASLLTAVIILFRVVLEKAGLRAREPYRSLSGLSRWFPGHSRQATDSAAVQPLRKDQLSGITDILKRSVCVAILALVALHINWTFMIAPPLLVAFTEFSNPAGRARKKPVSTILLITMCAIAGAACRMILTVRLGLPLAAAAALASVCLLLFLSIYDLYLPPAGAATILAMLIPETSLLLYPVQIIVGVTILMTLSILLFRPKNVTRGQVQ